MTQRPALTGVLLAGLVLLAVAGCGSGDGGDVRSSATSGPGGTPVVEEPNGPAVAGRVTSAGRPVEGVLLSPTSLDTPPQVVIEIAILTDRDGRYLWRLGPGDWEITASAEGFRPVTKRVEIRDRALSTLDFELERA